jgi:hypothetical protein
MLGNKWEPAQGTVVDVQSSGQGISAMLRQEHRYVVEVRTPTGEVIRGTVTEKTPAAQAVGSTIGVQVRWKSGEMKIDPNQQVYSVSAMMNAGSFGAYSQGPADVHVMRILGAGGQGVPLQIDPAELSRLAAAIRSGDPAARQAAMNQLRAMRDQARQQAASQYPAPPGQPPGQYPAPPGQVPAPPGQYPAPPGQYPAPPGQYPATPPFGAAQGGSPLGVEERLAGLKSLLDKGLLTESEYQSKRQQIIDGL